MPNRNKFIISEDFLIAAGYEKEVTYDRNGRYDKFDTLRFDIFTKKVNRTWQLEVAFSYEAKKPNEFNHIQSSTSLVVDNTTHDLNITTFNGLENFRKALSEALTPETVEPC